MEREWWVLPQMNQTIVRARERAHTFMSMCANNLPADSEEVKLSKQLYETACKLFVLINKRIVEEENANGR